MWRSWIRPIAALATVWLITEAGLVAPSIQVAAKLAIALGKSLDHMAGLPAGIGPSASDPATSSLIAKLQQLPPDRRDLVKALINVLAEKK